MKIYSDKLTAGELSMALSDAGGILYFAKYERIFNTRVRAHGWNLLLGRLDSRRRFNTGGKGAGERGAASRDDWGRFLAALYERDPNMAVPTGRYTCREDFHAETRYAYAPADKPTGYWHNPLFDHV